MILFTLEHYEHIGSELLKEPFVDQGKFKIERYQNHELHVILETIVRGEDCMVLGTIAPPDENLLSLLMLAHTLKKEGAAKVIAVIPYLAYSRHDKDKSGESMAAALIGQVLKASGVNEVWTIDLHSERDRELFPINIVPLSSDQLFVQTLRARKLEYSTLVAPDNGAIPRCQAISFYILPQPPLAHFEKHRTEAGIEHNGPFGLVKSKAVIVNDMIDTGETALSAAIKLRAAGANELYVMVSHGVFTGAKWKQLFRNGVKNIFCTDSIPEHLGSKDRRIVRLKVAPLIAAQIQEYTGRASVAVETDDVEMKQDKSMVYPVPEIKHFGVRTGMGTNPAETDQLEELE